MPLTLVHRPQHRAAPWHLVIQYPNVVLLPCPGNEQIVWRFRTRREAAPYYDALTQLAVPWDTPIDKWPLDQQEAVRQVLEPLLEARAQELGRIHLHQVRGRHS